jgi:hypothetical protein
MSQAVDHCSTNGLRGILRSGSRSMDRAWGLRSWARSAAGIEAMTTEQADAFEAQFADVRQSFGCRTGGRPAERSAGGAWSTKGRGIQRAC